MKRICNICEIEKDKIDFNLTKEGKYKYKCCKYCFSLKRKDSSKKYYEENKEKINLYNKSYYKENKEELDNKNKLYVINNKEKIKENQRLYYDENKEELSNKRKKYREENKEKVKEGKRLYYLNLSDEKKKELSIQKKEKYNKNIEINRVKKLEYIKEKMSNEPLFKLKFNIRTLIRNSIKRQFTEKSKKTIEILGCTYEEFKIYLESQFDENMNWENQGSYWHMDHIKPISLATSKDEVYKLNHYTNFQPLYSLDNLIKGNKY